MASASALSPSRATGAGRRSHASRAAATRSLSSSRAAIPAGAPFGCLAVSSAARSAFHRAVAARRDATAATSGRIPASARSATDRAASTAATSSRYAAWRSRVVVSAVVATSSPTRARRSGLVLLARSSPTWDRRNSSSRSIAAAAVASVPRVAAARWMYSWRRSGSLAMARSSVWPMQAVARKARRSRPSQREPSGLPSNMISLETSVPNDRSVARESTRPARSWRISIRRPSSSLMMTSTSQRSPSHGLWSSRNSRSATIGWPLPRRTPHNPAYRAACQLDLPASLGP